MSKKAISYGKEAKMPEQYGSLAEMLVYAADHFGSKGLTFVNGSGQEDFLAYSDLLKESEKKLFGLQKKGLKERDKLILVIDNSKEFYIAYWACILGGIIPAPVSQPVSWEAGSEGIEKLTRIWETLKKPNLLIEEKNKKDCEKLKKDERYQTLEFMITQEIISDTPGKIKETKAEDLIFLQFSSGSTGIPKGVMLTNRNILTNIEALKESLQVAETDVSFTWVPHTHDMGLFVQHLTPLSAGSSIFIFSPYTFVRSPYLFLKKFSEHKGSWFCSTNFGFDWMTRSLDDDKIKTLDFSGMRFALNGAEPISVEVTYNFIRKFSGCGFHETMMLTCYGMAEATVGVAIPVLFSAPLIQTISRSNLAENRLIKEPENEEDRVGFFSEGSAIRGIHVRIATQSGTILEEGQVAEIQIQGDSVTKGYYNNPEVNKNVFIDGWFRTGDLGYILDGKLFVTGRQKDMIIVRGQNYYAHDLEEVIYKKGLVARGNLVFAGSFQNKKREEILAFVKGRLKPEEFKSLQKCIISTMSEETGINVDHVIPVKSIPKTTSGKIQRYALKESYENGNFADILAKLKMEEVNTDSTEEVLNSGKKLMEHMHRVWAKITGIPQKDFTVDDPVRSLGGNSISMYLFIAEIEKYLGKEVGAEIFKRNRTIRQMSDYLETEMNQKEEYLPKENAVPDKNNAAITGLALRFPGAKNQQEFWENLCGSVDSISKVSEKRRILAGEPDWIEILGELEDIDCFDNEFFEIPDKEAIFMDPQQRIVLETAYEALEDAGIFPEDEEEKNIGVYAGTNANTYYQRVLDYVKKHGTKDVPANALIRNLQNAIAATVNHQFNFTGPALSIDTACSSFLVSLHIGAKAIERKEVDGAVIISSNIMTDSSVHTLARNAGILTDGTASKVFDAKADGSVLGEGAVVVFLEPLENAIKKGKHIYGVVKGSAVNNDGYSYGMMAPNPRRQYQVLKDACLDAGISPVEVSYIEAHGTGTTIGDPIELNALKKLYQEYGGDKNTCSVGIGSVKTNIGHLLPAAGGASLAKVLLCMQYGKLVPSLHMEEINPALEIGKTPFYVVRKLMDWDSKGRKRKAGITSLGLGGTNCHVIIEEWEQQIENTQEPGISLITVSAKTKSALERIITRTSEFITNQNPDLHNLAYTRNEYRQHYDYRGVYLLDTGEEHMMPKPLYEGKKKKVDKICLFIGDVEMAAPNHGLDKNNPYYLQTKEEVEKVLKEQQKRPDDCINKFIHCIACIKNIMDSGIAFTTITGSRSGTPIASLFKKEITLKEAVIKFLSHQYMESSSDEGREYISICLFTEKENPLLILEDAERFPIMIKQNQPYEFMILKLFAKLYVLGIMPDFKKIQPKGKKKLVHIPAYPFERKSIWLSK